MKTNKFFMLAAITCGAAFVSCSNDDVPVPAPQDTVIGFENATLNADGFWIGEATGTSFSYEDDWGGKTTTYSDNAYTEAGATFPVTYNVYESAYGSSNYWSGVAISNRTATSFDPNTLTPDQYNNVTGKAHSGNNFCVIQTYGETIKLNGATLKGFWYTNSAYTVNSIVNGDNYAGPAFDATDWFKCVLYPTPAGENIESGARFEIDLAKDGDYVKEWKYCDLSNVAAFKNVKEISIAFEGSRSNNWGVLTPAYICLDDIEVVVK